MPLGESVDVTASLASTPARADEDWYLLFGDRPRLADVTVSGIPGTVVLLEAYDETRTRRNRTASARREVTAPDLAQGTPRALVGLEWERALRNAARPHLT